MIPFRKKSVEIPGTRTISYLDNPTVAPPITDFDVRRQRIRAIILHTTSGTARGAVHEGSRNSERAEVYARYQARTERSVSWDITIDLDGDVIVQNDPNEKYSWHATAWNRLSMGIELVQEADGTLYQKQLDALVAVVDFYTMALQIQRQIAWAPEAGGPCLKRLTRADEHGAVKGADMVGIFAHCNNTNSRGPGDPGPAPFKALAAAGYEKFDFRIDEDKTIWRQRQDQLGCRMIDGIPLNEVCSKLGDRNGLWVARPGDADILAALAAAK